MDETENEEQGAGALSAATFSPADYVRRFDERSDALRQARAAEATTRREMFEQTERRLLEQQQPRGLRFGSPEVTQTLFGLANALVSPRPYGGFAGTMANVMPVLSQSAEAMNAAQQQRTATAQALETLRQQYGLDTAAAATAAAGDDLGSLDALARFYETPQPVWSENLQQFIPRSGPPVVTRSRALPDGSRADKLTDGTTRITTASGQVGFYDAGGNPINQGGAQ